jgi:hypothetical protein
MLFLPMIVTGESMNAFVALQIPRFHFGIGAGKQYTIGSGQRADGVVMAANDFNALHRF